MSKKGITFTPTFIDIISKTPTKRTKIMPTIVKKQVEVFDTLSARNRKPVFQKMDGPSLTVPDMSMSMREIIDRYTRGVDTGNQHQPIFEQDGEESEGIDPKSLDLAEVEQIKRQNETNIKNLTSKYKAEQQGKAKMGHPPTEFKTVQQQEEESKSKKELDKP